MPRCDYKQDNMMRLTTEASTRAQGCGQDVEPVIAVRYEHVDGGRWSQVVVIEQRSCVDIDVDMDECVFCGKKR